MEVNGDIEIIYLASTEEEAFGVESLLDFNGIKIFVLESDVESAKKVIEESSFTERMKDLEEANVLGYSWGTSPKPANYSQLFLEWQT